LDATTAEISMLFVFFSDWRLKLSFKTVSSLDLSVFVIFFSFSLRLRL